MKTLIIQSCSEQQRGAWMGRCIASVQQWARDRHYDYRFVGDEIFALVPPWYLEKIGSKLPVATDLARLALLKQALELGYDQAVWLDADVVVFDQSLSLDFEGACAFGQELWVQEHGGEPEARRNVHNAVCVFRRDCPVLPFLAHTVESLIRRVDPGRIAPQMVGPKLLGALHSLCDFPLLTQVGALSPEVIRDLCRGDGPALSLLRQHASHVKAVNICASLVGNANAGRAVDLLLARGRI